MCLSDEELLFILNAIGEKGIPGLNRDILQSDTECNQKLMDMAGRVLIARDFIKSDGVKLEIAKELLGVIYATIYPTQMVYLTVQSPDITLYQGFFKVPEMLITHTSTSGVNYFEVDTESALIAEPIIQMVDESLIGDGQDGQQLITLTQKDLDSIKQDKRIDTLESYALSDKTVIEQFSNTLKNAQTQMTLQMVYQLNPKVKQIILTIISDSKVNWLIQADSSATNTNNVTFQSISLIRLKQVIEEAFLGFATSDTAH